MIYGDPGTVSKTALVKMDVGDLVRLCEEHFTLSWQEDGSEQVIKGVFDEVDFSGLQTILNGNYKRCIKKVERPCLLDPHFPTPPSLQPPQSDITVYDRANPKSTASARQRSPLVAGLSRLRLSLGLKCFLTAISSRTSEELMRDISPVRSRLGRRNLVLSSGMVPGHACHACHASADIEHVVHGPPLYRL